MRPLVTVYITNFNYGKYIDQSIKSVLSQTFQDFELIIIDDGSTDNSREIIEKYRDHDKVEIIYQENKGLNITNNIAMKAANGKYLMRLDADDFLERPALAIMSAILEADDDLGLVFPDYYYVDKSGKRIGEERRHNFEEDVSLYDQPAHGACTMIRLSFLRRMGGYNESFTSQDGYDLWIKFITKYKVTNVNKPLFSYRKHGNNLTSNEYRILDTRRKIKRSFVEGSLDAPSTLAIIPIRNTLIDNQSLPLLDVGSKSLIENKVDTLLKAKNVNRIVLSISDKKIFDYCKEKFTNMKKVNLLMRDQELASPKTSLTPTFKDVLNSKEIRDDKFQALMQLSIDYPFTSAELIDEAVDTLAIFKPDSVISVIFDKHLYYQHNGTSLSPILNMEKYARYEREAVYKSAGGIEVCWLKSFRRYENIRSGRISHVIADSKSSFKIDNSFNLHLYKRYRSLDVD